MQRPGEQDQTKLVRLEPIDSHFRHMPSTWLEVTPRLNLLPATAHKVDVLNQNPIRERWCYARERGERCDW